MEKEKKKRNKDVFLYVKNKINKQKKDKMDE